MPRSKRIKSESGIYHIMIRGINKQPIFQDAEDNEKFIEILKICKKISGFHLFAFCLMGNHVHILLKEGAEPLETVFKRIGGRYVYWYNAKYQRVGHLFQDRYRSEPVETDEYFLTVIRYIHQNPVKAGLVNRCGKYAYSSYNEYFSKQTFIDTDYLFTMLSPSEYQRYHQAQEQNTCLEIKEPAIRLTDENAKRLIKEIASCETKEQFQALPTDIQDNYIKQFRESHISIRQISKLTGLSVATVRKV